MLCGLPWCVEAGIRRRKSTALKARALGPACLLTRSGHHYTDSRRAKSTVPFSSHHILMSCGRSLDTPNTALYNRFPARPVGHKELGSTMYTMDGLTPFEATAIYAVLVIAALGLLYALLLRWQILKEDKGTAKMQEVWNAIRVGADSYPRRQLRSILPWIAVLTVAMFFSVYIIPPTPEAIHLFSSLELSQVSTALGFTRALAFIMGATFSLTVGQLGMRMAVQGNVRVASASRRSFGDSLLIAYRTGTITGMLTDGLGLMGGTLIFIFMGAAAPDALLGFGFGGTLVALFMRVGGGIFTKAADVGADLVGKVEAGIPEDDPRNPAVVADLVGDNVGDCAGMAADIFESYEVT